MQHLAISRTLEEVSEGTKIKSFHLSNSPKVAKTTKTIQSLLESGDADVIISKVV